MTTAPPTRAASTDTSIDIESRQLSLQRERLPSKCLDDCAKGNHHHNNNSNTDPHGLLASYKSAKELGGLNAGASTALSHMVRGNGKTYLQNRRVRSFYVSQNATIERLLKRAEDHHAEALAATVNEATKFKIAIWGSLAANVVLSGLQLYAATTSGSLSLFTTMADSIFDPLSNITLIAAHRAIKRVDPRRFPAGRARLQTVGNIVFCFLMMTVGILLVALSVQDIAEGIKDPGSQVKGFFVSAIVAVSIAFATKLALFTYCLTLRRRYSQVRIVWQDHRNDLAINGFGILTAVGGAKLAWWIDPAGAIFLSIIIFILWGRTAFAEFMLLVGIVADTETQQFITYVSLTHSPAILGLDTVRVYHSGPRLIAEVDVVMDRTTPLQESHDVSETLQVKLETLPNIERAYVHVDYDIGHKPEHRYRN